MNIPSGGIIIWSGAIVDIPSGYVLCDGNNDTPDLRDRFVFGAGDSYNPGDKGGANSHAHNFTGNGHTHNMVGGSGIQIGAGASSTTSSSQATGTTGSVSHLPPYYALAFIMKT